MTGTHTIWICADCEALVANGGVPIAVDLTSEGALVTLGFRDPDDHHMDCDFRNSQACGDHGYDCNVSCEQWDECPDNCHGCGAKPGARVAATVWPAMAVA
jgi:hypothetical protein